MERGKLRKTEVKRKKRKRTVKECTIDERTRISANRAVVHRRKNVALQKRNERRAKKPEEEERRWMLEERKRARGQ